MNDCIAGITDYFTLMFTCEIIYLFFNCVLIHVMSLKVESGRFSFHFREVFEKCIDYIGKFLVHFREVLKFS